MSEITDRLVDNIIEVILEDMDCRHEVNHDEDGSHTSVEYNLKYELKVRNKIIALLKPKVTEEWIEEKATELFAKHSIGFPTPKMIVILKDFIHEFARR